METNTKPALLKKPFITGAAVAALLVGAFSMGAVLSPHQSVAQAIQAKAPKAAQALPSFADLVDRVAPAVVAIDVTQKEADDEKTVEALKKIPPELRPFIFPGQQDDTPREVHGGGSGFFISKDGYIVTNNHVVKDAAEIKVTLKDGSEFAAKLIGRDERTDLAVIKIEGNAFPYVQFEPNSNIRVGDWVVAIGNPFGLGGTATAGIVSALGRENVGDANISDFIQIDAPINPGNSGGPTFDMQGRVIGVNTAIVSGSGGNIGIGFAVPSSIAQNITKQLITNGKVSYGWLGVLIQDLNGDVAKSFGLKDAHGAIVGQVTPDSPAAKAGLKRGDVILKFNGQSLKSSADLTRKVGATPAGTTIKLDVADAKGNKRLVSVLIAPRPSEKELAQKSGANPDSALGGEKVMGMTLAPMTDEARQALGLDANDNGLVITDIDKNSRAAKRGLRSGDALLAANGQELQSPADLKAVVDAARRDGRDTIGVYVQSRNGGGFLALPIDAEK